MSIICNNAASQRTANDALIKNKNDPSIHKPMGSFDNTNNITIAETTPTRPVTSLAEDYGDSGGLAHPVSKSGPDMRHGIALYLEDVSVWFDSFRALNDLSLYIEAGELRCIIGPNGAGKTTLMDVITGKTRPTKGSAFLGYAIRLDSNGQMLLTDSELEVYGEASGFIVSSGDLKCFPGI